MTGKQPTPIKRTNQAVNDGTLTLTLKISRLEVAKAYQLALTEAAQHLELPGFRKGKVPLSLAKKNLDQAKLYSRVLELVLPPVYTAALKKANLTPIINPEIQPIKVNIGEDWEFTAKTALEPIVKLGKYQTYIKSALSKAKPRDNKDQDYKLRALFDAILKNSQATISPLLVQREASLALDKLTHQLTSLKLSLSDFLKNIKKTEAELHAEYQQTAQTNLHLEFALKNLIKTEKITITNQEMQQLHPPQDQENYVRYLLQKKKLLDKLVKL